MVNSAMEFLGPHCSSPSDVHKVKSSQLPDSSQTAPDSSQTAPGQLPGGSQIVPRQLPDDSQTAPRQLPQTAPSTCGHSRICTHTHSHAQVWHSCVCTHTHTHSHAHGKRIQLGKRNNCLNWGHAHNSKISAPRSCWRKAQQKPIKPAISALTTLGNTYPEANPAGPFWL